MAKKRQQPLRGNGAWRRTLFPIAAGVAKMSKSYRPKSKPRLALKQVFKKLSVVRKLLRLRRKIVASISRHITTSRSKISVLFMSTRTVKFQLKLSVPIDIRTSINGLLTALKEDSWSLSLKISLPGTLWLVLCLIHVLIFFKFLMIILL